MIFKYINTEIEHFANIGLLTESQFLTNYS